MMDFAFPELTSNIESECQAYTYCSTVPTLVVNALDVTQFVADRFSLNLEQSHAFRLVADHSTCTDIGREPLYMYLGGAGGTGKSQVIKAWTAFFEAMGQARKLRLCAFTGAAARNINGCTLHSSLNLSQLALMLKSNGP
jgi:hypothetical protein